MSCGVGHRHASDSTLLWLWYRLAAVALIQPLAWEPLYAAGAATKRQKKKTKQNKQTNKKKQKKKPFPLTAVLPPVVPSHYPPSQANASEMLVSRLTGCSLPPSWLYLVTPHTVLIEVVIPAAYAPLPLPVHGPQRCAAPA